MAEPLTAWDNERDYQDWLNDLMAEAGDEWDTDESMERIVTNYVHALALVKEKAAGLVRTAHPTDVGDHEVVRQWWDALVAALEDCGTGA